MIDYPMADYPMAEHTNQALFDLAINRAARVTALLGTTHLEAWHSKTRFAIRIPLETIRRTLEMRPHGQWYWQGGTTGRWFEGKSLTP